MPIRWGRKDIGGQFHKAAWRCGSAQAFVRDGFGQYRVESRNAVGGGHDRNIVFKGVHAADFSAVERFLSRQGEIVFSQSVLLDFIGAADRLRGGAMLPNVAALSGRCGLFRPIRRVFRDVAGKKSIFRRSVPDKKILDSR